MSAPATTTSLACHRCQQARETKATPKGEPRLPRGWKRHRGAVWCDRCWRGAFVLRAVTIPVATPHGSTWAEFRHVLHEAWSDATGLANWAVTELARHDVTRTPEMEKLPPLERRYLYPAARQAFPALDPTTTAAILQAVERRYRASRYDVIWRRAATLPTYRFPAPYPVHNQTWSVRVEDGGALVVSLRIGGERRELRLRGGEGFRRQRRSVLRLIEGAAAPGELAIYQRGSDVMCKMVLWLPRRPRGEREQSGTLHVRTVPDAVWEYHVEGREPERYHADRVRQWVRADEAKRRRLGEDRRLTRHSERGRRAEIRREVEDSAASRRKHRNRLATWTQEAAAMLARYAERQGVGRVVYDDSETGYADLPWYRLREQLAIRLDAAGIAFLPSGSADSGSEDSSGDVMSQ